MECRNNSIPDMENTALVLEGGGLRGVYTSGVLHYLMAQRLYLPYASMLTKADPFTLN